MRNWIEQLSGSLAAEGGAEEAVRPIIKETVDSFDSIVSSPQTVLRFPILCFVITLALLVFLKPPFLESSKGSNRVYEKHPFQWPLAVTLSFAASACVLIFQLM